MNTVIIREGAILDLLKRIQKIAKKQERHLIPAQIPKVVQIVQPTAQDMYRYVVFDIDLGAWASQIEKKK